MEETWDQSLGQENPLEKEVFLPGEFHGQTSLAGYSPWGRKESDTTEQLILYSKIYMSYLQYLSQLV